MTKLDEFHYHEILDRTHLLLMSIDTYLVDHPAMSKKWIKHAEKAQEELLKIYSDCGKRHLKTK